LKIISAEFVTSAAAGGSTAGIPRDGLPQLAMTGRSNVGKSTLLNALCRSKVARTSAAPGKTRLANVYRVTVEGGGPGPALAEATAGRRRIGGGGKWGLYLVDLPGYGYARGGADAAEELREVAEAYFAAAGSRAAALLLIDSRHPGLEADLQAAHWVSAMGVDYRVVATKIDKLSRAERARNMKALELTLGMPPLPVSAASGEGMDTLWKTIASLARTGRA
jgi:GTP-binding protein